MLAQQRRDRLLAEMQKAGIDAIIAFGTNWQEAYLRYVSDFCILEGSGVAVLTADGDRLRGVGSGGGTGVEDCGVGATRVSLRSLRA